jgi:Co/Zn/Cd efflux system component
MSGCSSCASDLKPVSPGARKALWVALVANALMFLVEFVGSLHAGSISLRADAIDFFGDAANYAVTLFVLSMAVSIKAKTSMAKGIVMGAFGIWVLATAIYNFFYGVTPHAETMGVLGFLALLTNLGVSVVLYRYRDGDSNMQSAWLCSRNDAISNLAVMLAAVGVFLTHTRWPDLAVAILMASLGLSAAIRVIKLSKSELAAAV